MSRLLQSNRKASAAAWAAELTEWEGKLAATKQELEAKQAEAADVTKDIWWSQQLQPHIDLLKEHHERETRLVAALKLKLAAAEAARPAALKELAAAYKERDALADEIRQRYPALVAELADLMDRAAANEQRLLAVAATGEGEINSTSPWEKARGKERAPLVIHGPEKAVPPVTLTALDGQQQLWPRPAAPLSASDLPPVVTVANKGSKPLFGIQPSGHPIAIEPGASITNMAQGVQSLLAAPGAEFRVH